MCQKNVNKSKACQNNCGNCKSHVKENAQKNKCSCDSFYGCVCDQDCPWQTQENEWFPLEPQHEDE